MDHLLSTLEQVGEVHKGAALLRVEARRLRAAVGVAPGDAPLADGAGPEDARSQTVAVVDDVEHRLSADFFDRLARRERFDFQPADRFIEQLAVEDAGAHGLPYGVAFEAANLLDARFA